MKKLIALVAGFAMLSAYGFASAHPDVTFSVKNTNNASIVNTMAAIATTGGNTITADQDVEGGEVVTGNAETNGVISNDVNQTAVDATVESGSDVIIAVESENNAVVTNAEVLAADTGKNEVAAQQDVSGGKITTGNAKSTGLITSDSGINVNLVTLKVGKKTTTCNDCTGVDDVTIGVYNKNNAALTNEVVPVAGTGENTITAEQDVSNCNGCGLGGALIDTGDATAEGVITNDENQNQITGEVYASSDVVAAVENDNNATEASVVTPVADTGSNEIAATEDVSGGKITTGIAKSVLQIFNRKNISIVGFTF